MIDYKLSDNDYKDIIKYGIKRLRVILFEILFIFIIGFMLDILFQTLIFTSILFLIRRFAGGYHANTEVSCYFISFIILTTSLLIIKYSNIDLIFAFIIHSLCLVLIFILSPIDNINKPLSRDEYEKYRKITRLLSIGMFIISLLFYCFKISFLYTPAMLSYVIISVLLISGFIKNKKRF